MAVVGALWLLPTAAAFGAGELAGRLAKLTRSQRRRWRWAYGALLLAVWSVAVVAFATDPMTAIRWASLGHPAQVNLPTGSG